MSVEDAKKAVEQAQAAYNTTHDKAHKKALKTAQAALAAEEAKQQAAPKSSKKRKGEEAVAPVEAAEKPKKQKKAKKSKDEKEQARNIDNLRTAFANAKAAYKLDKTSVNKAKKKEARKALKEAEAPANPTASAPSAPPTPVSTPAKTPAAPPSTPAATSTDMLAGLKSSKKPNTEEKSSGSGAQNPACDRVFAGNLDFNVDDEGIKKFFSDCGQVTRIGWIEDKETGRFKGCGVLDFDSVEAATKAVAKNGELFMGRTINLQFSTNNVGKGGGAGGGSKQDKFVNAPLAPKPDGCVSCFLGNLSFDIEEDDIRQFAEDCGEITGIRWVYNKDSGEFKGCGFIDFADTQAVDKFIAKKGTVLKGRPIRIDYSASRGR